MRALVRSSRLAMLFLVLALAASTACSSGDEEVGAPSRTGAAGGDGSAGTAKGGSSGSGAADEPSGAGGTGSGSGGTAAGAAGQGGGGGVSDYDDDSGDETGMGGSGGVEEGAGSGGAAGAAAGGDGAQGGAPEAGGAAGTSSAGAGGTKSPGGSAGAAPTLPTLPTSKRFDLDASSDRLFWKQPLHDPHHIMQSFAFDNTNRRIYFAQLQDGGSGDDLCITETDLAGNVTGHMHHANAGHGVSIGVEPVGADSYLWVEDDSSANDDGGRGTSLLRFKFVDGKTPAGQKFFKGSSTITAATDPVNKRIAIRRKQSGKFYYSVYALSAAAKGDFSERLAHFPEPSLSSKSVTFQGYTIFGSYLYTLDGTGHDNADDINSYVTRIDMKTGKVEDRSLTKAGVSLIFREPEGMAVYTSGGETRLCIGLGSHNVVGGPNRLANVYYKNVFLP